MLLSLILIPLFGIFILSAAISYDITPHNIKILKSTALAITILDLIVSLIIFILFDYSSKQFQFVQEHYEISYFDFYLGIDGLSIYFVLLTTIIMPISLISNWKSIKENTVIFLIIILLLETSLLMVFLILDMLLFYIFFESILAPLFILIGLYGSNEKVRASFYLFLYTLLGSLFMLLSIITMLSLIGTTDFDVLSKTNFLYLTQLFLFYGIFIAFAVKTPIIYLNNWLLKAHVESPLSGSIILAGIVLKLSLYGILRLILPLLPKAFIYYTYLIFLIGVLTIIYASLSTLRTIDIKELIAYSSVSHAAVYLLGVFSNVLHGIEGGITLGLAHGFVSSGLFICAGGVLYDRSSTRLITYYRGIAQVMPLFSIMFFILSLGNCGVPLTLNFIGEFMSLYGVFERLPVSGALASLSIIFSAAYTIFMFNRIAFAGTFFIYFWENYIPDLNKREFHILLALVLFTVLFGLYPAPILDGLHYSAYTLLYNFDISNSIKYDTAIPFITLFKDSVQLDNNLLSLYIILLLLILILQVNTIIHLATKPNDKYKITKNKANKTTKLKQTLKADKNESNSAINIETVETSDTGKLVIDTYQNNATNICTLYSRQTTDSAVLWNGTIYKGIWFTPFNTPFIERVVTNPATGLPCNVEGIYIPKPDPTIVSRNRYIVLSNSRILLTNPNNSNQIFIHKSKTINEALNITR